MANTPAPTMSDRGWVVNPGEKADFLMSWFFESDPAQTYIYKGKVLNIQNMLEQYGNDIPTLVSELQQGLEGYFQSYYDAAIVQVSANDDPSVNPTNEITLTIAAQVTQNGNTYSVSGLVQSLNGRFVRVANYINTGVLSPT
jgi:hypothetical protein